MQYVARATKLIPVPSNDLVLGSLANRVLADEGTTPLALERGLRPAFPDNVPRAVVREDGRRIFVNGAYRHGFLLAPVLARVVADYLGNGSTSELLVTRGP